MKNNFILEKLKMKKETVKFVLAIVFCLFFVTSSQAVNHYWMDTGVAGYHSWKTIGNWGTSTYIALGTVPASSADLALIYKSKECVIGTDMVGGTKAVANGVYVGGGIAGTNAFLTIKGEASFTSLNLGWLAAATNSRGTVRIDPNAVVTVSTLYVGHTGTATYSTIGDCNMMGGTLNVSTNLTIGNLAYGNGVMTMNGGTVNFTGTGSTGATIGGTTVVGTDTAKGKLTVNNGAFFNAATGIDYGGLNVGSQGTGELIINSGGRVKATATSQIGRYATSQGQVTMNGGILEFGGALHIGNLTARDNFMQLNNDANVTVGTTLYMGYSAGGRGRLTIAGSSAKMSTGAIILGAGSGSTAIIELQGGILTGTSTLTITNGTINITGGMLILPISQLSAVNGYIGSGRIYSSYGGSRCIKVATTATQVLVTADPNVLKLAYNPIPSDGSAAKAWTTANILLQWSPGDGAASHKIYGGTDYNDVNDGVAGVYQGEQLLGDETFSFNLSTTLHPTTLYWRVDEFDGDNTWKGAVWKQDIFVCQREDLNMDYTVDGNDLKLLAEQWLESGSVNGDDSCAENMIGDINGDCKVDFSDFAILSNNWKKQSWYFQEPTIKDKLGSSHMQGRYYRTTDDFLNEGADKLLALDTHIIKIFFNTDMQGAYPWNSVWPQAATPLQRAQLPYVAELFEKPFTTYILMVTEPVADWHNGMTPEQQAQEQQNFYELTRLLLHKYSGTGKTFVLQDWEGDTAIRNGNTNPSVPPTSQAIAGMIQWLNARQAGVNQARNEYGFPGVRVFNAAEIWAVVSSMDHPEYKNMVTEVLPYINVDLVSYSARDATLDPTTGQPLQPQRLHDALDYIASHTNDSPDFGDNNIYIGEFGVDENHVSQQNVETMVNDTINTAFDWGCQYVVFWQLYSNELWDQSAPVPVTNNNDVYGIWLIRPDGTFSWAYTCLRSFLQ